MSGPYIGTPNEHGVRVVEAISHDLRMAAVAIRWDVFVIEQHVPVVLEVDARDFREDVTHLVALDSTGRAIGTVRVIPDGADHYHLGRLAVRRQERGKRAAVALVNAVHDVITQRTTAGHHAIVVLDSQVQAAGFYRRLGYSQLSGEIFLDAGIEHLTMSTRLGGAQAR